MQCPSVQIHLYILLYDNAVVLFPPAFSAYWWYTGSDLQRLSVSWQITHGGEIMRSHSLSVFCCFLFFLSPPLFLSSPWVDFHQNSWQKHHFHFHHQDRKEKKKTEKRKNWEKEKKEPISGDVTSPGDIRVRMFLGKCTRSILMCFYGCTATVLFLLSL